MKEFWLITRKLTAQKIFNLFVRWLAMISSLLTKRYINIGMPWSYSIEPCNICNLKCKECVSGLGIIKRRRGRIDINDFHNAIDEIAPYAINLFLYFQGEPTMHPNFSEMVKYAHQKKIFTATSTNGHYLDNRTCEQIVASGLDKIIISLDGYNQNSYSAYRVGGDFDKVIQGIHNLAMAKQRLGVATPIIEVQTLVNKINENHLDAIRNIAIKNGADHHYLKTMQIENLDDFAIFKTSIEKYSRYNAQNQLKNPVKFCNRIINSAIITIDMDVLPCCYDKDANLILGNLRKSSLRSIIKSDTTNNIISSIEYKREARPDMCKNCGG
jgi:radical SAM protein with 4Fe4S-binding SPASM domain